ncbi:hypothetical protein ABPG75_005096 [Micractinium tetrahymenae]
MEPAPRSSARWSLLRRSKREALQTMPADYGTPGIAPSMAIEAEDHHLPYYEPPPPELGPGWDPVSAWLPPLPATPAAERAAAPLAPSASSFTPQSGKPRSGLAAAWGRLKRRLSGSGRRGSRTGAGEPSASAALPAALHTTGSLPLPAPEVRAVRPYAPAAAGNGTGFGTGGGAGTWHARNPLPPRPAADAAGSTPGNRGAGSSSTPGSSEQLLRLGFADSEAGQAGGSAGWAGAHGGNGGTGSAGQHAAPHAPGWQRPPHHPGAAARPAGTEDHTARRLVFSPAGSSGAGMALQPGDASWPIPVGAALQNGAHEQQRDLRHQQGQQAERQRSASLDWQHAHHAQQADRQGWQQAAPLPALSGLHRSGSQPIDVPAAPGIQRGSGPDGGGDRVPGDSSSGLYGISSPRASASGTADVSGRACRRSSRASLDLPRGSRASHGAAQQAAFPRGGRASIDIGALPSGTPASLASLAGSLLLPAAALQLLGGGAHTGLAGRWVRDEADEGPAAAATAAAIDALLQLPPLVAAARDRTRELQISESDGELALAWTTHLAGGARIRSPPLAYPKSGALAEVPRLDGRPGGASAQLSLDIDGSVTIKALQGPPLPALILQRLRLSSSGTRLRIVLKVQLLEGTPGYGGAGAGGRGGAAKQSTTWRRVAG